MKSREARLERIFRRLLLLSAAAAPLGCSTGGSAATDGGATPRDATTSDAIGPATDGGGQGGDATTDDAQPPDDASATGPTAYGYDDAACNPQLLDGDFCTFYEALPCGLPPDAQVENCALLVTQCGVLCNQANAHPCGVYECLLNDAGTIPQGPLTLECTTANALCAPGLGRRPSGLADARPERAGSAVGAVLAEMARLEAASVFAFRRLRSELATMRAPKRLVRKAERSARDETRHARVTARLARRRGALPAPVVAPVMTARSLEAFATENAVEGCVRESFGALVAMRQAERARDPEVRREMGAIARDETRHAALAWEVAAWVEARLDRGARERVRSAMNEAVRSLRNEVQLAPRDVAAELGLPTGDEARVLVDAFAVAVLS